MANYHISKDKETGKWNIQKEGATRSSGSENNQKDAERRAKELAGNGLDGKIRDSDTVKPGNDPNPPKDAKH
jgi:hypothetical protein